MDDTVDQVAVDQMAVDQVAVDQMAVDQVAVDQIAVDQVAVAKLFFESMSTVNDQFNSQMEGTLKVLLEVLPGQYDNILTQFIKEYMKYLCYV